MCVLALVSTGWRVLAHGFQHKRGTGAGEIALIACRGRVVAFIEVKARATLDSGVEAVSEKQRSRITRGADVFMASRPDLADSDMRFDVMVVRPWRWPIRLADAWRP